MGSFQLPLGFRAAGVICGIKADPTKRDLSLFVSDAPCAAAGVFTQNRVVGAPVHVSRERVPSESVRGVVINSGNANACTGEQGLDDARWMTAQVATRLGCDPQDVLVCSTGVIGRFLPRETLAAGLPDVVDKLGTSSEALMTAAQGIMTTDTVPKLAMHRVDIGGRTVTVTGVAKGAAMIAPNMATMLAVVMTDARLSPVEAALLLKQAVDLSFNCISIDQHTSTSDTVLLLANGEAAPSTSSPTGPGAHASGSEFCEALTAVCMDLAQQIIRDAEGCEHFVTIDVSGARDHDEAHRLAMTVANSPLVKAAIAGNDPNWGRIVSAAGYAGVEFDEAQCSLSINGIEVYRRGTPTNIDPAAVSTEMATGDVHIDLRFTLGGGHARVWTSDLTAEYVRLNSEYTT
ncbi:MAG: bifunctional glutamate N-acetyltransferase/amino-acid acetyltransferase ArgJ [Planctomycetaceae bacterium]|nr:bifunctional glutamate N-acetyltransferase/amino-acid acetyltransferase ArgJ [Planctomycetaceae bacterium]